MNPSVLGAFAVFAAMIVLVYLDTWLSGKGDDKNSK
jgi:hypothetical protein